MARLACIAFVALLGCDDGTQLLVDVRTDYVPGREFSRVEVVLRSGDTVVRSVETITDELEDYLAGERVAELDDLAAGSYSLAVTLRSPAGEVARVTIPLAFSASRGVTVVVTRDCAGVACPEAGGSADATACLNARCVEPACLLGDRTACVARCASDPECGAASSCTRGRCIDGVCLVAADPAACPGSVCDPQRGCVARADAGAPPDAALPDAGRRDAGLCSSDAECPTAHACREGMCVRACAGRFCEPLEVCVGSMCVPADCPAQPRPMVQDSGCTPATFMCLSACTDSMCATECLDMDAGCYDCLNANIQLCAMELGCGPLWDCYGECVLDRCPMSDEGCILAECAYDRDMYLACVGEVSASAECDEYRTRCLD